MFDLKLFSIVNLIKLSMSTEYKLTAMTTISNFIGSEQKMEPRWKPLNTHTYLAPALWAPHPEDEASLFNTHQHGKQGLNNFVHPVTEKLKGCILPR